MCCGCRPGVSVYAATGRDAWFSSSNSSSGERRSGGGPGTAIVFHGVSGQHVSQRYLYQAASVHTHVHTQVHIQNTSAHTSTLAGTMDSAAKKKKGQALDCSPVAACFHGDFRESHQHFHIHICTYTHPTRTKAIQNYAHTVTTHTITASRHMT